MISKYLAGGALLAIVVLGLSLKIAMGEVKEAKRDLADEKLAHQHIVAVMDKERQNAAQAALRSQQFYQDVEKDNAELQKLRDCVANSTCGVRIAKGACPKLPSAGANAGGTEAADAADRERFEQDYFSLIESIKLTKSRYEWMQRELIARSDPEYCKP
jgi:hypothetical protein